MAIPFNLPSDEETEDNYRRLDQLLLDLYGVLRQILCRPRLVPSNNTEPAPTPPMTEDGAGAGAVSVAPGPGRSRPADDVIGAGAGLPDLVTSCLPPAAGCGCVCGCRRPRHRRHRRRRRQGCCQPVTQPPRPRPAPDNWLDVGEQLRKIAEDFRTSFKKPEEPTEKEQGLKVEVKSSGLFSLLVPARFRHSLWTTVILLVGWRLLVRSR